MLTLDLKLARKRSRLATPAFSGGLIPNSPAAVVPEAVIPQAGPAIRQTSTSDVSAAPDPARVVTIEYCVPGNYEVRARELARALETETGCRALLEPSRDGSFEVSVDGRRVFSKRASWRFPDHDEILYHVVNG